MAYCNRCAQNVQILAITTVHEGSPKTDLRCSNCFSSLELPNTDSQDSFHKARKSKFKKMKEELADKHRKLIDQYYDYGSWHSKLYFSGKCFGVSLDY